MRRWRQATRAQRRILGPVYLSGGITIGLVATLFALGSFSGTVQNVLGVVAFISFGTVPLFFLAGLLRTRLYRAAARLLREVPDDPTPEEIQAGLRRVLGDPTLVFLTWIDEVGSYVDTDGNRCQLTPVAPEARGHRDRLRGHQARRDRPRRGAPPPAGADRRGRLGGAARDDEGPRPPGAPPQRGAQPRAARRDPRPDVPDGARRHLPRGGRPARVADPPARGADRPQRPRAAAARRRRSLRGGARAAGLGRRADDRVPADDRRRGSRLRGADRARGERRDDRDRPRLHRADAARGGALAPPRGRCSASRRSRGPSSTSRR